jgi:hypothetical protein
MGKEEADYTIMLAKTKKACPGSGSLTLDGSAMSGSWDHYGGFPYSSTA